MVYASGCRAIIVISPHRPSAKQKRDDDGECGEYAAHTKSIAEPTKNAHMRPGQLAKNQYLWYNIN
jgi:hypothetical protein